MVMPQLNLINKVEAMIAVTKAKEAGDMVAAKAMLKHIMFLVDKEVELGHVIEYISVGKDLELFKYWYNHKGD